MDNSITILFSALGLFILYLIFDFFFIMGADINKYFDKWVERTIWIWLPFYALPRLIRDIILKEKK